MRAAPASHEKLVVQAPRRAQPGRHARLQPAPQRQQRCGPDLESGHIVASEREVPSLFVNPVAGGWAVVQHENATEPGPHRRGLPEVRQRLRGQRRGQV